MRLFTPDECAQWCEGTGLALDANRRPTRPSALPNRLHCHFPRSFTQLLWFARSIENALHPRRSCLVWFTDWGIFTSNENDHLYYRLRESYGDHRLLHEAPGHLCLDYEGADIATLIWLGMLFGWDAHVIPTTGYGRAFVSHDEYVDIAFDDPAQLVETRRTLEEGKIEVSVDGGRT